MTKMSYKDTTTMYLTVVRAMINDEYKTTKQTYNALYKQLKDGDRQVKDSVLGLGAQLDNMAYRINAIETVIDLIDKYADKTADWQLDTH